MAELPVNPFVVTDFKDIELASEIYDLNQQGKKPTEILDILSIKRLRLTIIFLGGFSTINNIF